jgi:hydrogenase-4 membrane subunit HyfE
MAFVGFSSIVAVLRQSTGKLLSPLHVLFTRLFFELGLMATAFAMLAPTLAICGIRESIVWQISSAIMLAALVPWHAFYPVRRKAAAPNERMPLRFYILIILGTFAAAALFLNIIGAPMKQGPGPVVIATVYALSVASVVFIRTCSAFLRD